MVDATLQDAATMAMRRNFHTMSCYGVVNELSGENDQFNSRRTGFERKHLIILSSQFIQAFLNNVITVEILDKGNDVHAECHNDCVNLRIITGIRLALVR